VREREIEREYVCVRERETESERATQREREKEIERCGGRRPTPPGLPPTASKRGRSERKREIESLCVTERQRERERDGERERERESERDMGGDASPLLARARSNRHVKGPTLLHTETLDRKPRHNAG